MKTEDLIATLASRATPVQPLPSPARRFAGWLAVSAGTTAAGVALFGLRHGLDAHLQQPGFVAMAALSVVTALAAGAASLVLAVPGAERSPALRMSAVSAIGLWTSVVIAAVITAGTGFSGIADWPICFARVAIVTVVPAWVLFGMIRRASALRPAWTGALAAAGATALAAGSMPFVCPIDDPAHALLGHLGPLLLFAAVAAWAGPALVKRKRGA